MENNIRIFVDSGAFSAATSGTPVVLSDYIDYIHANKEHIDIYPVLDVIGDDKATWENQAIMEREGLNPLPVFHVEDDIKYLHKCLDYEYFCLGGLAGGTGAATRQAFLNRSFDIICDTEDRMPKCKVHGFGLASPELMTAYPFYSVDTSSWVVYSRYGYLVVPKVDKDGNYRYDCPPNVLIVTERSPYKKLDGQHLSNMAKSEREAAIAYIEKVGFQLGESLLFDVCEGYPLQDNEVFINKAKTLVERTIVPGVSNDNAIRAAYSLAYYQEIANSCPPWPWAWKPKIRSFF